MTIIEKTIASAIRMLEATGCKFVVKKPDGSVIGEIKDIMSSKKTRAPHVNNFAKTGYSQKLDSLAIGGTLVLDPEGFNTEKFRGAVCATANAKFGAGNYKTCISGGKVEIIRIG